jgi:hypothetical protein
MAYTLQGDFVADALLDPKFPDPRTWNELRAYVTAAARIIGGWMQRGRFGGSTYW